MDKGIISSFLLGAGCGGLGSMIGTIWNGEFGWIFGTILGIFISCAIIVMKGELLNFVKDNKEVSK